MSTEETPELANEKCEGVKPPIKKILTEDTGKMFEMALCLALETPHIGPYKYSMEEAEKIKPRLLSLKENFGKCIHTAEKGSRYDFTLLDTGTHLSLKTCKKGVGKVAPQVIGQATPEKFCHTIGGIVYTNNSELKQYIQTEIVKILPILVGYTFDCPNLYYNKEQDTIRLIKLENPITWDQYTYKWTCDWKDWNNSSTLKIVLENCDLALLEIQFHTKRKNMAVRWCYENFLTVFNTNLHITHL